MNADGQMFKSTDVQPAVNGDDFDTMRHAHSPQAATVLHRDVPADPRALAKINAARQKVEAARRELALQKVQVARAKVEEAKVKIRRATLSKRPEDARGAAAMVRAWAGCTTTIERLGVLHHGAVVIGAGHAGGQSSLRVRLIDGTETECDVSQLRTPSQITHSGDTESISRTHSPQASPRASPARMRGASTSLRNSPAGSSADSTLNSTHETPRHGYNAPPASDSSDDDDDEKEQMLMDLLYGRMCGEWHARGVKHCAPNVAVSELFVLDLGNDCELAGRNCDPAETDQYHIDSVHIYRLPPSLGRQGVSGVAEGQECWHVRFIQR